MTSLDMQGFSITVVPYSEEIEKGLLAQQQVVIFK